MRIVYLVESAAALWGGVKSVLEDANELAARGHEVTVVARSEPPDWMTLRCVFTRVPDFAPEHVPDCDLVIATWWPTVQFAVACGRGVPVHYCQGFEGDNPENAQWRAHIEATYRRPETAKITISAHLTGLLRDRFGWQPIEIDYAIDDAVMRPGEARCGSRPVRVGLVGPSQLAWKDVATGIAACRLAAQAGLDLQLVRVSNTPFAAEERTQPFAVELHERVPPARMGDLYRTLDVFLGTSRGHEEGFFLPAVEAMACGVPCVLTEVPAYRGYGDGAYALWVPPGDAAEMAQALVLATTPHVASLLRAAGLAVAQRYTRQRHVAQLEGALHRILAARAPRARAIPNRDHAALQEVTQSVVRTLRVTASAWLEVAQYDQAVTHLDSALRLAPGEAGLLADLAHARYLAGDDEGALRAFDEFLTRQPDDADAHASRALVLFSRGDAASAAAAFERAIALGATGAEVHNNLGVARHGAGDVGGARAAFAAALAIDPQHEEARANLQALR